MRIRRPFIQEEGMYEGESRLPDPGEIHSKKTVSFDDFYDWYPEKQSAIKVDDIKFESTIDLPIGEEYKLKSQPGNDSRTNNRDSQDEAEINLIP